uniref:Uncharacterized protein n=1 Tax=Kalanchoe fedtschenkoi TaxID=63787 RepID=A0A7N0VFU2_KALFE
MATGWMKSMQCKSKTLQDVYTPLNNTTTSNTIPKHLTNRISSSSCRQTVQNLKDIVEVSKTLHKDKQLANKAVADHRKPPPGVPHLPSSRNYRSRTSSRVEPDHHPSPAPLTRIRDSHFPALTELREGHPSRNVVEIIFHTSWSPHKGFPGRVEMIFKVQNMAKTVTRFEEYREAVKARSGSGHHGEAPRCIADGNEVMGFQCLGSAGAAWVVPSGKGVCTFSGSGGAHESGGGGRGRRAMMVCRVIAGRVGKRGGSASEELVGADSVGGEKGELFVFDSRAVLPCFLIIYNL